MTIVTLLSATTLSPAPFSLIGPPVFAGAKSVPTERLQTRAQLRTPTPHLEPLVNLASMSLDCKEAGENPDTENPTQKGPGQPAGSDPKHSAYVWMLVMNTLPEH